MFRFNFKNTSQYNRYLDFHFHFFSSLSLFYKRANYGYVQNLMLIEKSYLSKEKVIVKW